ncbi:hypothetical protein BD779DRAFT_1678337 [Infundibulicybe gibba]|nr:hypothetical protein BD779DRAFT_1678337 [Infundibulicybe gibba]
MATPTLDIGQTFGGGFSIEFLTGAMLVGGLIAMVVYGITTLQMYFYFINYPKDSFGLKTLVATTWTLDTLHTVLVCYSLYTYLILGFGNPRILVSGTCSGHYLCVSIYAFACARTLFIVGIKASAAANIPLVAIAQGFFTLRIYRLSRRKIKWILSSVIGFTVFAHFCFGIETVIYFSTIAEFSKLNEVTLKSESNDFKNTNNLITKLIIIAINRCVLTCAAAIAGIIVFVAKPQGFYTFGIDFVIGKLYANSLLATLNARRSLGRGSPEASDVAFTSFHITPAVTDHGHISLDEIATQDNVNNTCIMANLTALVLFSPRLIQG